MLIRVRDLELRSAPFDVEIPAGDIDYSGGISQAAPLRAKGVADLLSAALGEVRIHGKLAVTVEAPCDRCLERAAVAVENNFDLVYVPADNSGTGKEEEVDESATEVGYYEGEGIELNDVLREVVLLALPMQVVCVEDCRGICPVCGQNRNQNGCNCVQAPPDDRWSKLKAFKAEVTPGN
jgi:uncharacterized protein